MRHNITTFAAITALTVCGVIFWESGLVLPAWGLIILLYLGIVTYGAFSIRSNYFLKSINKGKKKAIALTFDDGPDPDTTPAILDILKQKDLKATFFVIGKRAESHPAILRRIHEEGHTIGNHTYSHHYMLGFFTKAKLKEDILHCSEVVERVAGVRPLFFRPPFGVTNPRYATVLKETGLHSIGWSLRSLDTRAKSKYRIINKIISKLKARDIVLLHDTLRLTADSLEDVIEHCLQKGLHIVPLPQLIQKEPYATP